jgi:PAS domain S-box-containing protein
MAVDAAGCIVQLNAQIEKMFGYSREELSYIALTFLVVQASSLLSEEANAFVSNVEHIGTP